jgi:hypothetical protein
MEDWRGEEHACRVEGRGGWEKEEKEGEVHGRRLGHTYLHAEWKGEEDGRRRRRRERAWEEGTWEEARAHGFAPEEGLGHTDLHGRRDTWEEGTWICMGGGHMVLHRRRAHGFAPEEGTRFCTRGGHTAGGNGLTSFSYLLSVHANCLMKC